MIQLRGLLFFVALLLAGCCSSDPSWILEVRSESTPWAIRGDIVGSDGAFHGWVVIHRGLIVSVGREKPALPKGSRELIHDGFIYPGLIDTHNHAPWNVIPKWRAGRRFSNRYEWQAEPGYMEAVGNVFYNSLRSKGVEPEALRYGEIRALLGGTTTLQSTYPTPEAKALIRNLDQHYLATGQTTDIRKIPQETLKGLQRALDSGEIRRLFVHVAEGRVSDPNSRQEFEILGQAGLHRSGVVVIHGIAFDKPEFSIMAKKGMYLVWSPQSNTVLYGETARIPEALAEGVTVALSPDWTITGSDNVLEEIKVAWDYSKSHWAGMIGPKDLFRMVTENAALVAGAESFLGRIVPKYAADLFLAVKKTTDPFDNLIAMSPRDIRLVFVDGQPIYGDLQLLKSYVLPEAVDELDIQGEKKGIVTMGDPLTDPRASLRFGELKRRLEAALPQLAPLLEE